MFLDRRQLPNNYIYAKVLWLPNFPFFYVNDDNDNNLYVYF